MTQTWQSELVPPQSGRAWHVTAGSSVQIIDVVGGQTGDVFAVAADDVHDGLSSGRSIDYNGTIRLTTGARLYSRRSRPLLTIVADEVGTHDFLYAPCSQEMFEIEYGATTPHPNCFQNLTTALANFGVPPSSVTIAFNIFLHVAIAPDGSLALRPPATTPGQSLTFTTTQDLFLAVTSCSTPTCYANGTPAPLQVEIKTQG